MTGEQLVEDQQEIVFAYELRREDFEDTMKILLRRRRAGFLFRPWFMVSLAALGVLVAVLSSATGTDMTFPAVFLIVYPALLAWTPRRAGRNALKANAHHGPVRMSAGEHGITVTGAHAQARQSWTNFGSCVEMPRVFLLRSPDRAGRCAAVIPKRGASTPADVDRLRALIGRHLPLT